MRYHLFSFPIVLLLIKISNGNVGADDVEQCTIENKESCDSETDALSAKHRYAAAENGIIRSIEEAIASYKPCVNDTYDFDCKCHAEVIERDLKPFQQHGISKDMLRASTKFGTRYQIFNGRLYREEDCMFPARCSGIEYFLRKLLPNLPNVDLLINPRDYPAVRKSYGLHSPVFSFSKTEDYNDIMYPAWTFWEGGPAISLHPKGIGRWDLQREKISKAADKWSWERKISKGFFRGSRTSDERDALVLLSRRLPDLVNAQYTKNQAWKSPKDTLNAEPAKEISFEGHCQYKYLFNFRGIAASFRFKHLFLCKSLVFHVGDEWNEFFYFAMKPWVHYVPVKSYPTEQELEDLVLFFQQHDSLAQSIAERGYEFIWKHLRMQDIECYWKNLLQSYSKLLKYNVTRNNNLHDITNKGKVTL